MAKNNFLFRYPNGRPIPKIELIDPAEFQNINQFVHKKYFILYAPGVDLQKARFVSERTPPPIPIWQDSALVEKWKNKLQCNS